MKGRGGHADHKWEADSLIKAANILLESLICPVNCEWLPCTGVTFLLLDRSSLGSLSGDVPGGKG